MMGSKIPSTIKYIQPEGMGISDLYINETKFSYEKKSISIFTKTVMSFCYQWISESDTTCLLKKKILKNLKAVSSWGIVYLLLIQINW